MTNVRIGHLLVPSHPTLRAVEHSQAEDEDYLLGVHNSGMTDS